MKKLLLFFAIAGLQSCYKDSNAGTKQTNIVLTRGAVLPAYTDDYVSITDFCARMKNEKIEVSFTAQYARHVTTLEILRGFTVENFCSIFKQDVSHLRNASFSTTDDEAGNSNIFFYMVKYTLDNGNWSYTPVIVLK